MASSSRKTPSEGTWSNSELELQEKQALLASLEPKKAQVKADRDKLIALHLAGELPTEGFGEHYRPLEAQYHQLADQIPSLQGEIDFLRIRLSSSQEVVEAAQDVHGRWQDLSPEEKREIVEAITERITVDDGTVLIQLTAVGSITTGSESKPSHRVPLPFCTTTLQAPKQPPLAVLGGVEGFAGRLRARRLELGLTQRELGTRLGVAQASVHNWERARKVPGTWIHTKLSALLG